MLATLSGAGLASAAGLNAYIPLLFAGLLSRYTDLLALGSGWQWLEHPVTLVLFGALLVLEVVADKVPAVDSVNDVVQTVVRPTSGGITFGAGSTAFTPDLQSADGTSWGGIVAGVLIALVFHLLKAAARPVLNTVTFGVGGPVVSTLEDVASAFMAVIAIVIPLLVLVVLPATLGIGIWAWRRRRRRKRREAEPPQLPDAAGPPGP